MKTAKKILCLTLVLVMALGLVQLATAATDFTDDADINYPEAAAVLAAIETIDGYPDGSFGPGRDVTREEAAAMIARMLLGRDLADKMPVSVSFPDVPLDSWSAKYVAYCAAQGIILGRPDGKFYPKDPVTGAELAIMLLRALGLGTPANYVGAAWAMNAILDGMKFGILTSDVDYTKPANREETALYIFNALIKGDTVKETVTRYQANAGPSFDQLTPATDQAKLIKNVIGELYTSIAEGFADAQSFVDAASNLALGTHIVFNPVTVTVEKSIGSIATDLYKLEKTVDADAFMRPDIVTWRLDGKSIYSAPGLTPKLTYTTAVQELALFADLGLSANVAAANVKVYVDGKLSATPTSITYDGKGYITDTGNGALTEVYKDGSKYTIVIINTYIGEIIDVAEATAISKETVTVSDLASKNAPSPMAGTFIAAGFEEDDIVLYTAAYNNEADPLKQDYVVQSVVPATDSTVVPTARNAFSFTAGGKVYGYSAQCDDAISADDVLNKAEKIIYLDAYGYAIMVEDPDAALPQYAIVIDWRNVGDWTADAALEARLLLADGTTEVMSVTDVDSTWLNKLVEYKTVAGGKVELTDIGDAATLSTNGIVKNRVSVNFGGAVGNKNATNRTLFFVRDNTKASKPYSVYTGISAIASVETAANVKIYLNAAGTAIVAIYLEVTKWASAPQVVSQITYVNNLTAFPDNVDDRGVKFTTYSAYVNGEIVTIEATATAAFSSNTIYGSLDKDDAGFITGGSDLSGTGIAQDHRTGITPPSAGVIFIGGDGFLYNSDTVFYRLAATGFTKIAAAQITDTVTYQNANVVYYTTNNILTAVFITP